MSSTAVKKQILRIRYDREDSVLVHPLNDDVYVVTAKEAVEAIQQWASPFTAVLSVVEDHMKTLKDQSEALLKNFTNGVKNMLILSVVRISEYCPQMIFFSLLCNRTCRSVTTFPTNLPIWTLKLPMIPISIWLL